MQVLVGGLTVGAVYALIALGMSLIYSISRVINLAQGGFVVLAALLGVALQSQLNLPAAAYVPVVLVLMSLVLAATERLVIRPAAKRGDNERLLLVTVGVLQAIGGLLLVVWGNLPYTMRPFVGSQPLHLLGASVPTQVFWVLGALIFAVVALWWLLNWTGIGLTLRATAERPDAARLMGVDVDRMRMLSFTISGFMAALAGLTIIPLTFAGYDTTTPYAVNGFIAAVLGGLGRVWGAVAGGLLLGILQGVFGRFISGTLAQVVTIALLILLLLFRPTGLFGVGEQRR